MRNYIILNGNNSNEITGLLIQTLPPITQAKIRTNIEEIDGRDGDVITKLGYGSYTKEFSIGLYGNFNVDDIIAYFTNNQSGKVTFSNEPDKYYNYEIIDQIDYERLVRYRVADVTFHVQPFKYPLEEEPLTIEPQYVTGTGSNISLDNTANSLFDKLDLKGNTEQETTTGKNLTDGVFRQGTAAGTGSTVRLFSDNGTLLTNGETYTVSTNLDTTIFNYALVGSLTQYPSNTVVSIGTWNSTSSYSFTATDNYCLGITIKRINEGTITPSDVANYWFQLEKGSTATSYEPYTGGIASPNPDYPQEVKTVTGENTVNVVGRNLINVASSNTSWNGANIKTDGTTITYTPNSSGAGGLSHSSLHQLINIPSGTTLTYSQEYVSGTVWTGGVINSTLRLVDKEGNVTALASGDITTTNYDTKKTRTVTLTSDIVEMYVNCMMYNFSGGTTPIVTRIQLEKGSTASPYEEYKSQSYIIDFGDLEFCGFGGYQDYLYQSNDTWYKHKEIEKTIQNGTGTINAISNARFQIPITITAGDGFERIISKCNIFTPISHLAISTTTLDNVCAINGQNIYCRVTSSTTLEQFKALLENQNAIFYYVLATPIEEEITDENLIEQLENLKLATSYEGQTNISHEYSSAPIIFDVSAVQSGSDKLTVENEGNIYSRPVLDLEGTGIVKIALEGNQIFQVDLTNNNEIVIDTNAMEAYDPETQNLMNRNVTGNYDNFKLSVGDNELQFSGALTEATVTNYTRWL